MSATRLTSRPAATAARLRASMLIGALLVGQVATFLHQATVTHTRCAEHGELMHGQDGAELAAGELAAAGVEGAAGGPAGLVTGGLAEGLQDPVPARDSARLRGLPGADDHEHDHCWMTCAERARAGAGDGQAIAAAPPTGGAARLASRAPASLPVPLYRTAPKTSPPV